MARIRGPLFSLDARGNYAGKLQYRGGLQGTHAYRPRVPFETSKGEPSAAQLEHRNRYGEAYAAWNALDAEDKANWSEQAQATGKPLSGWNLYLQAYLAAPITPPPPEPEGPYEPPPGNAVNFTSTGAPYAPPPGNAVDYTA